MSNIQEISVKGRFLVFKNILKNQKIKILKYTQEHFPYVQKSRSRTKSEHPYVGLYIGVGGMAQALK